MQESAIQKCYGKVQYRNAMAQLGTLENCLVVEKRYDPRLSGPQFLVMRSLALWSIDADMFITTLHWKSDVLHWLCYSV